jgi:hypothetical protein
VYILGVIVGELEEMEAMVSLRLVAVRAEEDVTVWIDGAPS